MPSPEHQTLDINGIQLSLYSSGPHAGPVVWLLHGFPECWYSWRHQITALSDAGYRVYAPEMRGYGASSAPEDPAQYDLMTLCGDIQAAMDELGHTRVAMIGHDWGAPVAWHLALLEPERVQVVSGLSVPFGGRPKKPAIGMIRELYQDRFHYMLYFQKPGLAEAEMAENIPRTMRVMMHSMSGTGGGSTLVQEKPADARWLDDRVDPGFPPDSSAAVSMARSIGIATSNVTGNAPSPWLASRSTSQPCSSLAMLIRWASLRPIPSRRCPL